MSSPSSWCKCMQFYRATRATNVVQQRQVCLSANKHAQLPRISVDASDSVVETFKDENFKPKYHPGAAFRGRVCLPVEFTDTVKRILYNNNLKAITPEMIQFSKSLKARELPVERREYKAVCDRVEEKVRSKEELMEPFMNKEQLEDLEYRRFREIRFTLKRLIYHWEPVDYSGSKVLQYLMLRSDAEYAALYKILSDIAKRDPDFEPTSMLDFGSGLGTSVWAANAFWRDSLKEHLCVDSSKDMNDTAELILRQGGHDKPTIFKDIFFRQFLPTSPMRRYDLVTCAYSLLDLPSARERLEVLNTLWRKCEKYLVIVQYGTYPGFRIINEARDFILRLDRKTSRETDGHAFSPCPHDQLCPRFNNDVHACKFNVAYRSMIPFEKEVFKDEIFSYVVLKKGERSSDYPDWPRLLEEPLVRKRHVICRLCMSNGSLMETVVTKQNVSKMMYRTAKKSQWGDLLPVKQISIENADVEDIDYDEEKETER